MKEPCSRCGAKENLKEVSDGHFAYCARCFSELLNEEQIQACNGCNEYHHMPDLLYVYPAYYCDSCAEILITYCEECGDYHLQENCVYIDSANYSVCQSCYDEHFGYCEECDSNYHRSELNYDSAVLCNSCAENAEYSHSINNYGYKPLPKFFDLNKEKLYLGLEDEVEIKNDHDLNDAAKAVLSLNESSERIYLKDDSTIERGFEIVSHPMTLSSHKKFNWKEGLSRLVQAGGRSHDTSTCGLHVHLSKSFFSNIEIARLGCFINLNQRNIQKIARRRNSNYGRFKRIDHFKDGSEYNENRYSAVNLQNAHTIELRFFRGTLKYSTLIASLEFCDAIAHYVKQVGTAHILKGNGWTSFCNYVSKNNYKTLRDYMQERDCYAV